MNKPNLTDFVESADFVKSEMNKGKSRRSIRDNERQQDVEKHMADLNAANALGKISHSIARTMKAADKVFDEYHDHVVKILRRFSKCVTIDEWKVVSSKPLEEAFPKEYLNDQIESDLDILLRWIDRIWNYWTYFDDEQLKLLLPHIIRGSTFGLYMIKEVYGKVDFKEFSFSLVALKFALEARILKDKKRIELGIYECVEKHMDYFSQFGIELPPTYEEDIRKIDEENKRREKGQRRILHEAQMERALEESKARKRNKVRDKRKKHSESQIQKKKQPAKGRLQVKKKKKKKKKNMSTKEGESEMAKLIRTQKEDIIRVKEEIKKEEEEDDDDYDLPPTRVVVENKK
jgi:hypothetical protein